jgi:hypothetical protein
LWDWNVADVRWNHRTDCKFGALLGKVQLKHQLLLAANWVDQEISCPDGC